MKSEDRLARALFGALVLLSISVVLTGGLALYLTLVPGARARLASGGGADAGVEGGARIVYASDREGDVAIYTLRPDGTGRERISDEDQPFSLYPAWSPDGERVAYLAIDDPDSERSTAHLWVAALDGSEPLNVTGTITDVGGLPPAWSPDGNHLALASGGPPPATLYLVESDGGDVVSSVEVEGTLLEVDWSPSGDVIALRVAGPAEGESALVVSSAETGEVLRTLPGVLSADWSPDGRSLVYFAGGDEAHMIFTLELDGEPRQVADLDAATVEALVVSPDGERALLTLLDPYDRLAATLALLDLASGEVTRLVEDDGWLMLPSWSPDGQEVLYTRGPFRRRSDSDLPYANLWIYDLRTSTARQLTTEPGFAGFGSWSP